MKEYLIVLNKHVKKEITYLINHPKRSTRKIKLDGKVSITLEKMKFHHRENEVLSESLNKENRHTCIVRV